MMIKRPKPNGKTYFVLDLFFFFPAEALWFLKKMSRGTKLGDFNIRAGRFRKQMSKNLSCNGFSLLNSSKFNAAVKY